MRKDEIEDELRSHIELRADDLERSGVPRPEAERQARVEFGGYQRVREECREASGGTFLESVGQDIRYALRLLRRSPGFTLVAVLTLALAIGANAVVFSVMNGLVLRPLNVANPERLYEVKRTDTKYPFQSYPDYLDLRDRNRSFDGLAAFNMVQASVDAGDAPNRVWAYEVSGNYFDLLGVKPHLGRLIHSADEQGPNSAPFVVLSHAYWQAHLNSDAAAIGRSILLNKHPYTIVGVAPEDFHGTVVFFNPDFYVPMVNHDEIHGQSDLNARGKRWVFMTIGHLKEGMTEEQAIADLNLIGADIERTYPIEAGKTAFALAKPSLIGDVLGPGVRAFVTALMVLAGLILVAACTNLGSLFAARAADRSREVALRLALGAGRVRILRQLFTEAVLISLTGGAIGLAGSVVVLRALALWQPFPRFPLTVPVLPDASVYLVALLLAVVSGLLFGAVPMRQVLHASPYEIVKAGSVSKVRRLMNVRDSLLVVQIAICAVLVTASIVALRGLVRTVNGHYGFNTSNAVLANTDLDMAGYHGDAVRTMQTRMVDAVASIPGVTAVALTDWVPLGNGGGTALPVFADDASEFVPARAAARSVVFSITPDYFSAAGTVLLAGRHFALTDDEKGGRVAVINEELARRLFGSAAGAVGRHYKLTNGTRVEVVGVVEDGKYGTVTEDPQGATFVPLLQAPWSGTWMIVRTAGDAGQLATAISTRVRELDRGLPIFMQTWDESMNFPLFPSRVATASLGVLGMMGAMLSITGIFGMAAYSVSRRLRELGIRIALGARRTEILQAALGRAFKLLAIGSITGLGLGILASRVLSFVVYQATPRDPVVLAGVVVAMLVLGLLATWIPARRALSIDPLILLREQ